MRAKRIGIGIAALGIAVGSAGCMLGAMQKRNQAIAESNRQAKTNAEASQNAKRSDMYVMSDAVWMCQTADDARSGDRCEGGKEFGRAEKLSVIGQGPEGDVWRAEYWDAEGAHPGFIAAASLNELPDTSALDEFAASLDDKFPAKKRIPRQNINLSDFLRHAHAYKGRRLVMRITNSNMRDFEAQNGALTFTMLVPAKAGSRHLAPIQFVFASADWTRAFKAGKKSLSCGPAYCDNLVVVARLSGKTVERVDEHGNVKRLPVFTIDELADRFGHYRSE